MMKLIRTTAILILLVFILSISLSAQQAKLPGNFQQAYISGSVTYNGKPLTGVTIMAIGQMGGMAMTQNASNGNYALGVGAGEWSLMVTKEGFAPTQALKTRVGFNEEKTLNIEMRKFNSYIKGIVVDEAGKPLSQSAVSAMTMPDMSFGDGVSGDYDDDDSMDMTNFMPSFCMSDKDGLFTMAVLAGNYNLSAIREGYEMSPKNPRPKIPGLDFLPPGMNIPMIGSGVSVKVAEGQTVDNVKIILRPVKMTKTDTKDYEDLIPDTPKDIKPMPNVLVHRPCITNNNVLHWSRSQERDKMAYYVVVRSDVPFNSKEKGEVRTFTFADAAFGMPGQGVFSMTDITAVPGKTYWYLVYEKSLSGNGPDSNVVEIKTR
jgi:hypothetical protein